MDTKSLAHSGTEDSPRREARICAVCGEPSGSISEGTGRPLIRDKETGEYRHISCGPGVSAEALDAMVQAQTVSA